MALYGNKPSPRAVKNTIIKEDEKIYGMSWPQSDDPKDPYLSRASSAKLLSGLIKQVLLTEKGERVMLPRFGVGIRRYLFEPFTRDIATNVALEIEDAVGRYVPTAEVMKVSVFKSDNLKGYGLPGFIITLTVRDKGSNQILDLGVEI